ncbi:ATP synthase F1 subunit gamma [Peptostreptococcus canis]|uniref:ATP synthase gamma chain n=1 Tax=Peptostreptococcus canis TaxID=1159213 RepID=A0ABR6TMC0_9FIRM|nr:ATP synthase F1 subunit gamma [Peptostreptococcus canis]MBC2576309.1 ATP synthase F1 subunit gamma [Peptostreptococcus canis]MBP1998507.1 F-type H+-transporting ATPase subunit gamma [Peptostreptococcus canis]
MAGANMKAIKTRIASVNSTKQITNAMHLVASSKLRKAKQAADESSMYFNTMYETIVEISMNTKGINSEFLKERELKNRCHIIVAGDRGLAGGYNGNAFKEAEKYMGLLKDYVITVGKKAYDRYSKMDGIELIDSIEYTEKYSYEDVKRISDKVMKMFLDGEVDEVLFTYTEFQTALSQEAKVIKVLPLVFDTPLEYGGERYKEILEESDPDIYISEEIIKEREERRQREAEEAMQFVNKIKEKSEKSRSKVKYLPSPQAVLEFLIPTYITGIINGGVVESYASEQGARRTAMESATDNANEMIQSLELSYNRARQSAVTQEITEISAGVEALK